MREALCSLFANREQENMDYLRLNAEQDFHAARETFKEFWPYGFSSLILRIFSSSITST
jgi:hypothetical protein